MMLIAASPTINDIGTKKNNKKPMLFSETNLRLFFTIFINKYRLNLYNSFNK